MRIAWFYLAIFYSSCLLASEIVIIPLKFRSAEEVLPILQSVVNGSVQALGNKLIIKAKPQEQSAAQELVKQLDQPLRNLLIQLRKVEDAHRQAQHRRSQIAWDLKHGASASLATKNAQTHDLKRSKQEVRVLEGQPVWIATGQSQLLRSYAYPRNPGQLLEPTGIVQAVSGFQAIASLQGERVRVEIRWQDENLMPNQAVAGEGGQTVLSGRLGDWLPLGRVIGNDNARQTGAGFQATTQASAFNYELRVLPLDSLSQ